MIFLKIFLWFLFLPFCMMSVASLAALFGGEWTKLPNKSARVLGAIGMALPGLTLAYTLLWDWNGLVWFGWSHVALAGSALLMLRAGMRESETSIGELWGQFRAALSQVKNADLIIEKGVSRQTADARRESRPARSTARRVLPVLACEAALVAALAAAAHFLSAHWVQFGLTHVYSFGFVIASFGIGYLLERTISPRLAKGGGGNVPNSLLLAGCLLYMVGMIAGVVLLLVASDNILRADIGRFWTFEGWSLPIAGAATIVLTCGKSLLFVSVSQLNRQAVEEDTRAPVLYLRPYVRETRLSGWRRKLLEKWRQFSMLGGMLGLTLKLVKYRNDEAEFDKRLAELESHLNTIYKRRTIYGRIGLRGIAQSLAGGRGAFWDEQLVVAGVFNQIGPYITVARPNETIFRNDVGAYRRKLSGEDWHPIIIDLIRRSRIIVIEAGASQSLLWEIAKVTELAQARKVLLILPQYLRDYEIFRSCVDSILPVALPKQKPISRFVMFDDWWNPYVLENDSDWQNDANARMSFVSVLTPFLERNGFAVPTSLA